MPNAENPLLQLQRKPPQPLNISGRPMGTMPVRGPNYGNSPMTLHLDPQGIQAAAMRRIQGVQQANQPIPITPIHPPPLYEPPPVVPQPGGDIGSRNLPPNPNLPVSPITVPPLQAIRARLGIL